MAAVAEEEVEAEVAMAAEESGGARGAPLSKTTTQDTAPREVIFESSALPLHFDSPDAP